MYSTFLFSNFFFQAEDGIRDYKVTGVQTCALPISRLVLADGLQHLPERRVDGAVDDQEAEQEDRQHREVHAERVAEVEDRKSVVEGKRVEAEGGRRRDRERDI